MTDHVYDIEVLPNVFTCTALNTDTNKYTHFEISPRKNDFKRFIKWMYKMQLDDDRMVGFNSVHYDYPVIHAMLTEFNHIEDRKLLNFNIYKRSKQVLESGNKPGLGRFKYTVWDNDQIVKQIDLFKIYHFDNKAKQTSLKRLQFNMRLPNIVEFDVSFDEHVKKASVIENLLQYNEHDVKSTDDFRRLSGTQISFREEMGERLKKYLLNANDTKIGMEFLIKDIKEKIGEHVLKDDNGKKVTTKHSIIDLKDVIFPYVKFDNEDFNNVLEFMKTLHVFIIKGKFHWNEKDDYREGLKKIEKQKQVILEMRRGGKRKGDEQLDIEEAKIKVLKEEYQDYKIDCEVDDFTFDFGKGGLHGARKGSVYTSNDTHVIIDVDVTGYYPAVGIENGLYPEHLTEAFCPIYAQLPVMRAKYKKGTVLNKLFKLIQNSFYGNTNSEFSNAYDPKYTLTTTMNGQLMLCMLWEKLRLLGDIEIIQANTDGITFYINRKLVKKAGAVCRQWQKDTKMRLEQVVYKKMLTRDVNNYVCEYKGGGVKAKGDYLFETLYHKKGMDTSDIEWHKNHSMIIVQKAAQAAMLKGTPVRDFITQHDDIYDFFLCTNVNRGSQLYLCEDGDNNEFDINDIGEEIQRNTRYLVANSGGKLVKLMPPLKNKPGVYRRISIQKGYVVSVHNEVTSENVMDYDINYQFYITAALKLLEPFGDKI